MALAACLHPELPSGRFRCTLYVFTGHLCRSTSKASGANVSGFGAVPPDEGGGYVCTSSPWCEQRRRLICVGFCGGVDYAQSFVLCGLCLIWRVCSAFKYADGQSVHFYIYLAVPKSEV